MILYFLHKKINLFSLLLCTYAKLRTLYPSLDILKVHGRSEPTDSFNGLVSHYKKEIIVTDFFRRQK